MCVCVCVCLRACVCVCPHAGLLPKHLFPFHSSTQETWARKISL